VHYVLATCVRDFCRAMGFLVRCIAIEVEIWALDRWAKDWKIYDKRIGLAGSLMLLLHVLLFVASPAIERVQPDCRNMPRTSTDWK